MAHKTLIDGTAYTISGGKALVGGTAYSIKSGKTLVDGTEFEIGFGDGGDMATITFGSMPASTATYVEIDGVQYTGSTVAATDRVSVTSGTAVKVPLGTTIVCSAFLSGCDNDHCKTGYGRIYLNDSQVAYRTSYYSDAATYSYTVNGNISVYATQTTKECSDCEKGDRTNTDFYITEE